MPTYTRARPAGTWKAKSEGQPYTPVRKTDLEKWDQAIFDLKHLTFNVADYSDLVVSNVWSAAIQAAIDAAAAVGGGIILLPYGLFEAWGLTIPNGLPIRLQGSGCGYGSGGQITRLLRSSGTAPMISAIGASNTISDRPYLDIRDIEIDGGGTAGTILDVERSNELNMQSVRLHNATGSAMVLKQVWNARASRIFVQNAGSGSGTPAALLNALGSPSGGSDGSVTVHFSDCQWEENTGTDLKLTGTGAPGATDDIQFSNFKMERSNSGTYPFIDLDYAKHCQFVNGKLGQGGTNAGIFIQQVGTAASGAGNSFSNIVMDNSGSGVPACFVDHGVGEMRFSNIGCHGTAPSAAFFRVGSSVPLDGFRASNLRFPSVGSTRFLDNRAGAREELGYRVIDLLPATLLSGAVAHELGNGIGYDLRDAVTDYIVGQVTMPVDALTGGSAPGIQFRLIWTANDTSGNNIRVAVKSQNSYQFGGATNAAATSFTGTLSGPTVAFAARVNNIGGPLAVTPGDQLFVRVERQGADGADNLAATAILLGVQVLVPVLV